MRHVAIYDERRSRLAVLSRHTVVLALVLAVVAILLTRIEVIGPVVTLTALGAVLVMAAIAVLASLAGLVGIWRRGYGGLASAVLGLVVGVALLAGPAWIYVHLSGTPLINDISTDWGRPPEMRAAVLDRATFANPVRMPSNEQILEQRSAYPEVGPLVAAIPSQRVFEAVRALVGSRGWQVLASAPPDERGPGRIEAVARTPVLGFKDDVVVRVTNLGDGRTRVDMRSASRFGRADLGTNAKRIFDFLTELDANLRTGTSP